MIRTKLLALGLLFSVNGAFAAIPCADLPGFDADVWAIANSNETHVAVLVFEPSGHQFLRYDWNVSTEQLSLRTSTTYEDTATGYRVQDASQQWHSFDTDTGSMEVDDVEVDWIRIEDCDGGDIPEVNYLNYCFAFECGPYECCGCCFCVHAALGIEFMNWLCCGGGC